MRRILLVLAASVVILVGGADTVKAAADAVKRSSSAIAITADGSTLLVVNPDSDSVSLVDTRTLEMLAELAVGVDPRTVTVDAAGRRAWVANRGSASVSLVDVHTREVVSEVAVGHRPYGVVVSPDGRRLYVAEQGEGTVRVVDTSTLGTVAVQEVGDRPSGLAVGADGHTLYITHLLTGSVTVLDLDSSATGVEVALWPDSNLAQAVVLAPDGTRAYLPHTRSNTTNIALTFDTTVFPIVSLVDTATRQHLVGQQVPLDTVDPPGVGLPFDVAVSPDGTTLWVVNSASNDLTVVDLATRQRIAHVEVEDNPRGIVLSPDGSTAYVNNTLAGTVSVVDASSFAVTASVPVTTIPLPPAMLLGKRLFNSSHDPRLARDQWIACSSCHFDGEHDGRTWTFGFAGPRNTTSLHGMIQTYPLRWSAEWDESADSEFAITREQFGAGLLGSPMNPLLGEPHGGRSHELDSLGAFLDSLVMPDNLTAAELDPDAVARGEALFQDPVVDCVSCHPPPYFTDFAVHDVGTASAPRERLGPEIDTPTLRDLGSSAPYLHDGSAVTLHDVLAAANPDDLHGVTSHLDQGQLQDLTTYMLSLPANNSACVSCAPPMKTFTAHPAHTAATTASHPPRRPSGRAGAGAPVTGRVVTAATGAPVAGALVTVRATGIEATTTADGGFSLAAPATDGDIEITAWFAGYYIASVHTHVPAAGVELALRRYHTADNSDYQWLDPTPDPQSSSACGNCHPMILPQWAGNAHGGAVSNPRFFSFYNGTDVSGATTVEPGYLLDFPGTTGVCATCHAPGAAVDAPFSTDMNAVRGSLEAGIHCDFCHKLGGAWLHGTEKASTDCATCHKHGDRTLSSAAYEVYPNMPGVLSLRVLRPPEGEQIFIGPFPDIHDPDTYLPLMHSSALCAPCHQFSFWGTPIYTSYDEWLASPYSDPTTGQTCQDCHMPPTGDTVFALPEQGGLTHPPETIPSHLQLGATDLALLQDTVELEVVASAADDRLMVTATVTNTGAGHHVPTDHPGRHLLLVVSARDGAGQPLALEQGGTIPPWGGSLAGSPGTAYAKILRDVASGESPVVSYWKQALIVSDTRLPALAADTSQYTFVAPAGNATVTVQVLFRRLFEPIAHRYGWDIGELVMEERTVEVGGRG